MGDAVKLTSETFVEVPAGVLLFNTLSLKQQIVFISSFLNRVPLIQYRTQFIPWFIYCMARVMAKMSTGMLPLPYVRLAIEIGTVKIINANETVKSMAVPFMADLLKACVVDSVPPCLVFNFATTNL